MYVCLHVRSHARGRSTHVSTSPQKSLPEHETGNTSSRADGSPAVDEGGSALRSELPNAFSFGLQLHDWATPFGSSGGNSASLESRPLDWGSTSDHGFSSASPFITTPSPFPDTFGTSALDDDIERLLSLRDGKQEPSIVDSTNATKESNKMKQPPHPPTAPPPAATPPAAVVPCLPLAKAAGTHSAAPLPPTPVPSETAINCRASAPCETITASPEPGAVPASLPLDDKGKAKSQSQSESLAPSPADASPSASQASRRTSASAKSAASVRLRMKMGRMSSPASMAASVLPSFVLSMEGEPEPSWDGGDRTGALGWLC